MPSKMCNFTATKKKDALIKKHKPNFKGLKVLKNYRGTE